MTVDRVALAHYRERVRLADALTAAARRLWERVDPDRITVSWATQTAELLVLTSGAQAAAAGAADTYLANVLAAQGVTSPIEGRVQAGAFAGIASDGRELASLLQRPAVASLLAVRSGATAERALVVGSATLDMIVRTQVADAGRMADQAALTARRRAGGYVRMVVGKTCSRCLVLAGRWYAFNAGFNRHPRCRPGDCIHIPAAEDTAGDLGTDPRRAFDAMSAAEQDKTFGKAGADAIRQGADPAKVVNARRGMYEAGGRQFTTEAAGRRPRLMPEQILREADGDRDEAIRLLRLHGFLR